MATYTAVYTIDNVVHVCFEAENEDEAARIAEQMIDNGTVLEEFGFELHDFTFTLGEVYED